VRYAFIKAHRSQWPVQMLCEVLAVPGRVEGDIVETADVFTTRGDHLVRADGWPPHPERFERGGFDVARLLSPYGSEA